MTDSIFKRTNDDGSIDITIRDGEEAHKFSATVDGNNASVSYEETVEHEYGSVYVSDPHEDIWRAVMQSNEFTAFLDENGLAGARRER